MKNKLPLPITAKEKMILEFIELYLADTGVSPSYQEIRDHFGFASFNSVQNYLKQLSAKGYLQIASNQKRAIQILNTSTTVQESVTELRQKASTQLKVQHNNKADTGLNFKKASQETPREQLLQNSREGILSLPLLGRVAAGAPIEEFEHDEFIDVPPSLVRNSGKTFALKVKGQSMIEDGIFDGDIILVQKQANASDGEIIVASIDNESTVKRIFKQPDKIELRPGNTSMQSIWYKPDQIQIQGVVVGLLRKF